MNKLVSEQLPNDGAYHINRLVNEANGRLKKIGRQGKRATIVAKKETLSLQFTFKDGDVRSQKNPGIDSIRVTPKGIQEAERIAEMVTNQLVVGTFTWDWYNKLIGKDTSEKTQVPTCKEMVEQFKKHYFKQQEGNKNPAKNWHSSHRNLDNVLGDEDKPLSLSLVRQAIECSPNNTDARKKNINGLKAFLRYFGINDYDKVIEEYEAHNKVKRKSRSIPNDERIMEVYETGFPALRKKAEGRTAPHLRWQFLYGLLATYGLRIHEAWNIANWDKPVILQDGDWVTVGTSEDGEVSKEYSGKDLVIPAILDPSNTNHILCVKHETKTGYRMAIPISPEGHNWIEGFNLLQPLNLPEVKNPMSLIGKAKTSLCCSHSAGRWFRLKGYGFTPHDLRHAYNQRGHYLGYNPKTLSDSLGHSMQMNSITYLRHTSDTVKHQNLLEASRQQNAKRSRVEILEAENEALKAKLQTQENEIELLKIKLQLNETYR